jgi:protein-tyrosine kinase
MSHLFDALQKSEAERSGNGGRSSLGAAELLHLMEREAAAERGSIARVGDAEHASPLQFLVSGSDPSASAEADIKDAAPEGSGAEGPKTQIAEPEMAEKQRRELMKFIQNTFLKPDSSRVVVLTAIEAGAGCSWTCCRAAHLLAAQVKGSVCIVDANLRSPGLHQVYGSENHHGLSDALEGSQPIRNYVRPLGRPNLWLLSCGAEQPNRPFLDGNRVRVRIAELRQNFDYVLIDSPALSVSGDSIILGQAADAVVLVLKANATRREAARKAIQDLHNAGVRVSGAVLNQRTFPIPESIYNRL